MCTWLQEFQDVLSIETTVLRQNHSSVWHAVRNTVFCLFCVCCHMRYFANCVHSVLVTHISLMAIVPGEPGWASTVASWLSISICFRPVHRVGMCRYSKFSSDSDIKYRNRIRTVQKFDIHTDGFPTETSCNPLFKLKGQNNFTCIQCADKERFKTRPKPSHFESSPGSADECRLAPGDRRPSDQANWLGLQVCL